MERRRFNRIMISLPVEFHTRLPETDAPFQGQGIIRDISLGGAFFHVEHGMPFQPGQILSLSIFAPLPYLEDSNISHLQATGEVVRYEPPAPESSRAGVALNFLEGPTFCATPAPPMF
jgi:c-di-GMP-binding flagellar brake protein YcgR